jgi:hypothetical protein
MRKPLKQDFPPGWNEKRIREVINYYDAQTDADGAAEIETAEEAPGETWMSVPIELVPAVAKLIERHQGRRPKTRRGRGRTVKA